MNSAVPSHSASEGAALAITERGARKIVALTAKEAGAVGLRLGVNGGGCSGFSYEFDFARAFEADDHVFERDGARVGVDPMSLDFLRGSVIDYEDELLGARLVVNNPNAKSSCGCGASFSV